MTYAGAGPAHHKAKAKAGRQTTSTAAITIESDPGASLSSYADNPKERA